VKIDTAKGYDMKKLTKDTIETGLGVTILLG